MKEKDREFISVSNIRPDVVRRMLQFPCTNCAGDFEMQTAKAVYITSDHFPSYYSEPLPMASSTFFVIITCCFFGLVINQNWSREHRADHQLEQVPLWEPLHYLANRKVNDHGTSDDHRLLMDASKRGIILFRHRDDDSTSRIFRGRMNKVRKLSQMSRPRGHPLRWG